MKKNCEKACLNACGVSYVTEFTLQKKYPSSSRLYGEKIDRFDGWYSNANIPESYFLQRKNYSGLNIKSKITLIHIANMIDGESKGHYICLEIIQRLRTEKIDANLVFVGDGPEVSLLKQRADKLGISAYINFTGRISSMETLKKKYMEADFMVLPSKTEGVPRCIIEGMACGLICLASNVGGIPELLEDEFLFQWNSSEQFAGKIIELLDENENLERLSIKNQQKAMNYSYNNLQKKRDAFYRKAKGRCEANCRL
jgi:glycosyltransferase involved in cell wall biosynthesis